MGGVEESAKTLDTDNSEVAMETKRTFLTILFISQYRTNQRPRIENYGRLMLNAPFSWRGPCSHRL